MTKVGIWPRLIEAVLRATLVLALLWTNTFLHDMAESNCGQCAVGATSPSSGPVFDGDDNCFSDTEKHFHDAMVLANKPYVSHKFTPLHCVIDSSFCAHSAADFSKQAPRPPPLLSSKGLPLYLLNRTLLI